MSTADKATDLAIKYADEIMRLRAAVDALLEVARDVVSDGEGTLNPGFLALARTAIAQAEQAMARPFNAASSPAPSAASSA